MSADSIRTDLFFVMSGFILAERYRESFRHFKKETYIDFLKRRLIRIYPLHFLCLIGFIAVYQAAYWVGLAKRDALELAPPAEILNHLFLVQAWGSSGLTINYAAWAISIEWLLYLLFPLLVRPLLSSNWVRALAILGMAVAGRFALQYWVEIDWQTVGPWVPVGRGLTCFVVGLAAQELAKVLKISRRAELLLWALSPVLLLLALETKYEASVLIVFALLTWLGARSDIPGLPRQAAYWMGEVSCSLYISSGLFALIWAGLRHFLAIEASIAVQILLQTTLILAGAVALHLFIERPLRGYLRRRRVPVDRAPAQA